jgi:hypothetical protein
MSQTSSTRSALLASTADAKGLQTEGAIRAAHAPKKARLRPVPFCDRVLCSKSEAVRYTGIGRRKIDELIAERRLDTTVVDCRLYIRVPSLLRLIEAGAGQRLPEPPQMARNRDQLQ